MKLIDDFINKVLIIVGPTAVGKSDYAVFLALLYGAEVINCDMMQIYEHGVIGTGHINEYDRAGVVHHLIGFRGEPSSITVYEMRLLIEKKIIEILSRGNRVILVGGSLFCVMSLFFIPLRFYEESYGGRLDDGVCRQDEVVFGSIEHGEGRDKIVFFPLFDYALIEIDMFDRGAWRKRCWSRVGKFLGQGLLEEFEQFTLEWKFFLAKKKVIGYYEAYQWKEKGALRSEAEYRERVFFATCQYGKKQRTFARKLYRDLLRYGVLYKRYFF
jgi:tRNA A37 N6-isopentenylltransferase MiaA